MRLGVLSDLHCELRPAGSRWLNDFATDRLDEMADAALEWFAEEEVDAILVLGDIVQIADVRDLEHMLSRLAAADVAPLFAVNGNHDVRLGEEFAARALAHGVRLLYELPLEVAGVGLAGVEVARGSKLPQYVGVAGDWSTDASVLVVASHFPLLSEASRVAGEGIPYAGDLVNRAELETRFGSDGRPTVVLSGHIHVRCSTQAGALIQFTVGALIEPPYDATVVEIDPVGLRVTRTSRRFGEVAPFDPVLAADEESWRWVGSWERAGTG